MKFSFLVLMLCANIMCQEREYPPQDMSPHPVFATNSCATMLRNEHQRKLLDQRNKSLARARRVRSHAQAAQSKF